MKEIRLATWRSFMYQRATRIVGHTICADVFSTFSVLINLNSFE